MIAPCNQRRPKLLYPHHFTVYLDDETDAAVRAYAAQTNTRLAVSLRELIEFGLDSLATARAEAA